MRSLETGTIAGAIEVCRRRLLGATETPGLDARVLASHVTGLDASALIAYGDCRLDERRFRALMALAERRAEGEPVAYLIGSKEFCGLRISVNAAALVPRPETEELVIAVVADWAGKHATLIDVGTGSGAIACALAHLLPDARVLATDVSDSALELARENVSLLHLEERVSVIKSDLLEGIPENSRFDAIVANLPYVRSDDDDLDPRVLAHEPFQALFGGPDGLTVYRRLFAQAPSHLKPEGKVYCECSPSTAAGLVDIARAAMPLTELRDDASGRARFVIAQL